MRWGADFFFDQVCKEVGFAMFLGEPPYVDRSEFHTVKGFAQGREVYRLGGFLPANDASFFHIEGD